MEKNCIWCNTPLDEYNSSQISHTIPKSMGGANYYENECNECNSFFGNTIPQKHISIDGAFTNTMGFLKLKLMDKETKPHIKKPKNFYFDYESKNNELIIKYKDYKRKSEFESYNFGRLFIRSFYKIILSCFSEQYKNTLSSFDMKTFQDFCKSDKGEIKLHVWEKNFFLGLYNIDRQINHAEFIHIKYHYLYEDENIIEIEYYGIIFILQKNTLTESELNKSFLKSKFDKESKQIFLFNNAKIIEIKRANQVHNIFIKSLN